MNNPSFLAFPSPTCNYVLLDYSYYGIGFDLVFVRIEDSFFLIVLSKWPVKKRRESCMRESLKDIVLFEKK